MSATDGDTYPMPPDGWVCFHCGERFTTPGGAEDHFGSHPTLTAACRIKAGEEMGLVMALRRAEQYIVKQIGELPPELEVVIRDNLDAAPLGAAIGREIADSLADAWFDGYCAGNRAAFVEGIHLADVQIHEPEEAGTEPHPTPTLF